MVFFTIFSRKIRFKTDFGLFFNLNKSVISKFEISFLEKPRFLPALAINSNASLKFLVNSNFNCSRLTSDSLTKSQKFIFLNFKLFLSKIGGVFIFWVFFSLSELFLIYLIFSKN